MISSSLLCRALSLSRRRATRSRVIISKHWQMNRKRSDGQFHSQYDPTTRRGNIGSERKLCWCKYKFQEEKARWCQSASIRCWNQHWLVRDWKDPDNCILRYNKPLSMAFCSPTVREARSRGELSIFKKLSGLYPKKQLHKSPLVSSSSVCRRAGNSERYK